jgi:hypothetical protein
MAAGESDEFTREVLLCAESTSHADGVMEYPRYLVTFSDLDSSYAQLSRQALEKLAYRCNWSNFSIQLKEVVIPCRFA